MKGLRLGVLQTVRKPFLQWAGCGCRMTAGLLGPYAACTVRVHMRKLNLHPDMPELYLGQGEQVVGRHRSAGDIR